MNKIAIVYGSTTGNTETAAEIIQDALSQNGLAAELFNSAKVKPEDVKGYDLYVLGASTWGIGEMQDDFVAFYGRMTADVFSGAKAAVFGCGDSDMFADSFCEAVSLIADKAKDCGAEIVSGLLKIDGDVDDSEAEIRSWAEALL